MNKSKILIGLVLLLYLLYVGFQLSGYGLVAEKVRCFIFPIVTITYFVSIKKKSLFLTLFMILYSLSDILYIFSDSIGNKIDYYVGNYLYILAYVMLLIKVCKSISLLHVLKNLKIHTLVLLVLNVYIIYVLQIIIDKRIAEGYGYIVEILYNTVILLLLSASLLNYFYRDSKKALFLFLGSLCIVFSEVISVAYLYVTKQGLLDFFALSLALLAFYFFYQQSKLKNTNRVNAPVVE
ncbi:hypothetical protein KO566_10830 [Flavobacteriaceae bacterium XHP0103]|uniref:hypothetical protein n=1 Tax=Marixanthotalea marina TaxID=2844359 RepID=UPI002989C3F9|nr:hypothetical protein [Marixanthotalea marina]MBU3822558.1 hypothetical protein [Marixanthotalea marina]